MKNVCSIRSYIKKSLQQINIVQRTPGINCWAPFQVYWSNKKVKTKNKKKGRGRLLLGSCIILVQQSADLSKLVIRDFWQPQWIATQTLVTFVVPLNRTPMLNTPVFPYQSPPKQIVKWQKKSWRKKKEERTRMNPARWLKPVGCYKSLGHLKDELTIVLHSEIKSTSKHLFGASVCRI